MMRHSKRELKLAVDELAPTTSVNTVEEWLEGYCATVDEFNYSMTVVDENGDVVEEPDHSGQVCVMRSDGRRSGLWVPETDLPEWIDRGDFPVRG